MKRLLLFTAIILFSLSAIAQDVTGKPAAKVADTTKNDGSDPYDSLSYFMFGIDYLSDNVYLGRKDSSVIAYITPFIGYHHKSGAYAKAMVSFSPHDNRTDLFTLEAGYDHTFSNVDLGCVLDKYFYHSLSSNVRSTSQGNINIYAQYTNNWVEPTLSANGSLTKTPDFAFCLMLDHSFSLLKGTLNITPSIATNYGTQNYYDEYFIKKLTKHDKTVVVDKVVGDAHKFKVLDYELSASITYRVGKWLFTLTPTYAIPMSPAMIKFPNKTVKENLANLFYFELNICHR